MPISDLDDLGRHHDRWKNELSLGIAESVGEEGVDSRDESRRSKAVGSKFPESVMEVGEGLREEGKKNER